MRKGLAEIKARHQQQNTKTTVLKTESGLLNKIKGIVNDAVSALKPKAEDTKTAAKKDVFINGEQNAKLAEIKARHQQQNTDNRAKRIYDQAVEKDLVKEGTIEARRLQKQAVEKPDLLEKLVNKAPTSEQRKAQSLEKEINDIQQRTLNKSVKYVNPIEIIR